MGMNIFSKMLRFVILYIKMTFLDILCLLVLSMIFGVFIYYLEVVSFRDGLQIVLVIAGLGLITWAIRNWGGGDRL